MPFLFAGFTSTLPLELESDQRMWLAEGFEAYSGPEEIPDALLTYLLTLLSPGDDLDEEVRAVREGWRTRFGTPLHLEVLESRPSRLIRDLRHSLRSMEPGTFVYRGPPVGFCISSDSARALALEKTRWALTRKPWQFWL